MLGGAPSPGGGGDDLLTVTIVRDEHGYGMKVSGDNPVYVQSVKEHGAAWRAGLRAGDRILRVDAVPVHRHTHQQVVHMIRANPTTVLTVQQNTSRHKTPITAPVPVNPEKQRQLEVSKLYTMRLMLEQEQKYIRDLRNELCKVPDVRKQAQLESAELRCSKLQQEIDVVSAAQPSPKRSSTDKPNSGFLSGLPRSLSNLTGQSLRNLRNSRLKAPDPNSNNSNPPTSPPALIRQNSDETNKRRHNNTVPMVPTTCLDNVSPPPLPPRSIERPKRTPLSPPLNPLTKPKPSTSNKPFPMHRSMPPYRDNPPELRRSSHSLDGELDGPQPNSIAMQMNYPLVNAPPPPLQTDNRSSLPVLHMRSQSSPEQLDFETPAPRPLPPVPPPSALGEERDAWRGTPPPGTPPPPYAHNTQPCADPQRAIISMEEDDSPASDNSSYSGLFSTLRSVRESRARTAVLLNWLLGERRNACANLLLILTDGYRNAAGVNTNTLRRWAYEIQSTFLIPNAVLQLNGVDENMANEIEHVLVNEYDKEELLRNVFRKARQKAKEELSQQLSEFQVKRQVGLGTLYGPEDALLDKCDVDKAQEQVVVERLICQQLSNICSGSWAAAGGHSPAAHAALTHALVACALALHCRPASVAAAAGGGRAAFLQRDKLYKQRVKQLAKQHPQPYVVRGHHLSLQALTSVAHCHHCDLVIWGLAPQAYVCTDCKLRVHRACAKSVEEGCCLDGDHATNRISRFMERIHNAQPNNLDSSDKKSRKTSGTGHFLNMERSFRKQEDEQPWDQTLTPASSHGEPKREGSADEQPAPEADLDTSEAAAKETPDKDNNSRLSAVAAGGRGVNRAESCRERDAPRRGKHRNASDPNRLTAHNHHDLEPGAATAPSGSSSSSSLSSRSNESNTVAAEQQASQSDWSEEEEPLAAQWADSLPAHVLDSLQLSQRLRKRQEVIHELIVSEGSHVRWLKVLCRVFLRPLERAGLLPPDELRALFPNLPDVRDWHVGLHQTLRAARSAAPQHVVPLGALAEALLGTLGEPSYAACLSRFCRGQRLALESLRERRRKNKELHQFLASREQLPLCGRLQLRDLLACVWQRLTKYRLLLESVLKTVSEEEDSADDVEQLQKALQCAKDMLLSVDTAIRTTENEHRLRGIQAKLEVRAGGNEWDELRRLELAARALRLEGELTLRLDQHKKTAVLALMFEDMLVLLQREGEKFLLKPLPHQHGLLSPLIKWDKVLFRPNAAVRNTFFLMNINGVQMHELTANTAAEYATWVSCIQEAPLARVDRHTAPAARVQDNTGINVSRNPSDASEKSTATADEGESEKDRLPDAERDSTPAENERDDRDEKEKEDVNEKEETNEREEKQIPRRPTVGRVTTQGPALEAAPALTVREPAAIAAHIPTTVCTYTERLRRLDEGIEAALRAKAAIVGEVLGVPPPLHRHLAELAVADTLGQVDVRGELRATRQSSLDSSDEDAHDAPDLRQLLLAAHAQASQLTEAISRALVVNEAAAVAARSRRGRCDTCRKSTTESTEPSDRPACADLNPSLERAVADSMSALERGLQGEPVTDLGAVEGDAERALESNASAAVLAARLAGLSCGLAGAVRGLLDALPALEKRAETARRDLALARERADRLAHNDYQTVDDIYFLKPDAEQPIQDQPSNGG